MTNLVKLHPWLARCVFAGLMGTAAAGCSRSFAVIHTTPGLPHSGPQVTVAQGRSRLTVKTVAVVADRCNHQSDSRDEAIGAAVEPPELKTRCGVQLTEIERALSAVGLRVLSSHAIRELARAQGLSYTEAARALHAEAYFEINSLEKVDFNLNRLQVTPVISRANEAGEPLAADPRPPQDDDSSLKEIAERARSEHEACVKRLDAKNPRCAALGSGTDEPDPGPGSIDGICGAMLNVKVVTAKDHVNLWFYRGQRHVAFPTAATLARRVGGRWELVRGPERYPAAQCGADSYVQMIRDVADDMAQKFVRAEPSPAR